MTDVFKIPAGHRFLCSRLRNSPREITKAVHLNVVGEFAEPTISGTLQKGHKSIGSINFYCVYAIAH